MSRAHTHIQLHALRHVYVGRGHLRGDSQRTIQIGAQRRSVLPRKHDMKVHKEAVITCACNGPHKINGMARFGRYMDRPVIGDRPGMRDGVAPGDDIVWVSVNK